jgi:hypothetical protein
MRVAAMIPEPVPRSPAAILVNAETLAVEWCNDEVYCHAPRARMAGLGAHLSEFLPLSRATGLLDAVRRTIESGEPQELTVHSPGGREYVKTLLVNTHLVPGVGVLLLGTVL